MPDSTRLNKYLAHNLGLSRREVDNYIQQGRIKINGTTAELGNSVQPGTDTISLDNRTITPGVKTSEYLLLNKPVGYVCSRKKQGNSPTIYALIPKKYWQLKVAGRLDKDSCGLIMLTDDGDTIFQLTHPKFNKQKIYIVRLNKPLDSTDFTAINNGVKLEDGLSNMNIENVESSKQFSTFKVTMSEGRNRQIRRTFKAFGYTVNHLERIQFGSYQLNDLKPGQFKEVTAPQDSAFV